MALAERELHGYGLVQVFGDQLRAARADPVASLRSE